MKKNILTKSVFAALLLASAVVSAEEQYPAADFQPTVIYSDGAANSGAATNSASESDSAEGDAEKAVEKKAESSNTLLFGLVIAVAAGGFFLNKKSNCKAKKASSGHDAPSRSVEAGGLTGVERYVRAQNASAATGVEKYLARKEVADKEAALTGVDRYLRDRG